MIWWFLSHSILDLKDCKHSKFCILGFGKGILSSHHANVVTYVRSFQWRYMNKNVDLAATTACRIQDLNRAQ